MAHTLNETLKITRSPLEKAIVLDLLRQSPILQMIPIKPITALKKTATRWQTLPSAGTRKLGGAYTEGTGTTEQVEDTLFVYGGDIQVDPILQKVQGIENPLQLQTQMKVAALAAKINDDFFNNDHALGGTAADGFEGLKKRTTNQPARATIDLASAGDSLKVLASSTTQQTFIDALHTALHRLGAVATAGATNSNIAFFMNEGTLLGIGQTLRRLSLLSTQMDNYDRVWQMFGPAKLVDAGLKSDQSTEIITATEDPGDAGNDATSIYAVRFGGITHKDASGKTSVMDDDGLQLLQLAGTSFDAFDPLVGGQGGAGAAPAFVRRIDTALGLFQSGRYSVVRIKGFKMAAS